MYVEEHHVFFEPKNGISLFEAVRELEPWFDHNDIKPIDLRHTVTASGSIELQLTFRTRHEARLFEQAFCQAELT